MPITRRSSGVTRRGILFVALSVVGVACDMMGGRPIVGGVTLTGAAGTGAAAPPACGTPPETCAQSQPVITCDVENARDLGGMPLQAAGTVACGQLFRGPPLSQLSPGGCAETARLGIRTIIDLRVANERSSVPDDPCVGANIVLAPLPVPYSVSAENYIADFDTSESIARVFRTLADPAAYPIYFHCTYGRDRTGIVAAAIYLALGASPADIMTEYTLSRATVGAYPDSLQALMDEIARRGGIQAALRASGVTDADLAALRARVLVR